MSQEVSFIEGYVVVRPDSDPKGYGDYVILVPDTRLIYYWPRNIRLRGPSKEELDACTSNTQRRALLEPSFEVGQRVQCKVLNEARGIVSSVRKYGNVQEEYKIHDGVLSFKATCVVTDGQPRQCQASPLGLVEADQEYIKEALPHVPFNGYIVFDVDEDALQCRFRLHHIDKDKPIASSMLDYAGTGEWYTRGVESVELDAYEDEPEEVAQWRAVVQKHYRPLEKIEGRGFFVSMREIFCNAVTLWPVKVPWVDPKYRAEHWAGRLVNFKAYFCHHNKSYVVFYWREFDWPIETRLSGQNALHDKQVTTFKTGLDPTGIAGIFRNAHVGYVFDDARILDGFDVQPGRPVYTYIEHCFNDGIFKFRLHSMATEFYPRGMDTLLVSCRVLAAYVTGFAGQLYAAELYAYKCVLPTEMHSAFQPGQVVRIKAKCNASGVFETSEASAVDAEKLPVVIDGTTMEVALKLTVSCSTQHPMFFEHPEFGLIRTASATHISVARAKHLQPVIKVVDRFDHSPDARYRFKCVAIEPDGFR